jgi:hypothetical protein
MNKLTSRLAPVVAVLALFATGCGDDSSSLTRSEASGSASSTPTSSTRPSSGSTSSTPPSTSAAPVEGGRGWLDGDGLDWTGGSAVFEGEAAGRADFADAIAADTGGEERSVEPLPPIVDDGPLEAGSIDDGLDLDAYIAYRTRITGAGIPVRPLDIDDPTVISVTGSNGLPVLDAVVTVSIDTVDQQGQTVASSVTLQTTADGTTRFLPDAHAASVGSTAEGPWELTVAIGEATATASFTRGEPIVEITLDAPGGVRGPVPVDVHFLLDATGSMDDEIDRLRTNMADVAEQIAALPSEPDVRFGMTVYRDEGDLFVTRTFDLTSDLESFLAALDDVVADGGGDYPEALDEALADSLELPGWRRDGAVELVVLIADAPPQVGRSVSTPYTESALSALARGTKILPVAASGTDDQAEYVFRELAYVTGGRFVFLSYGVDGDAGSATGPGTDITPDDYDQLPLDQLVVRLVEDEILALTQLP